jgi:hypothetical protein
MRESCLIVSQRAEKNVSGRASCIDLRGSSYSRVSISVVDIASNDE